ncbi:MAG: RluA family pseudouridine synthase [Micrococcaceae bacterium]
MPRRQSKYVIDQSLYGKRLDAALAQLHGINRSQAVKLINAGAVEVKGAKAIKSLQLESGMYILVDEYKALKKQPLSKKPIAELEILHEDEDIIVVNKPAEVAAHPSVSWDGADVVTSLAATGCRISTSGPEERKGIVHRLDVGTSGVMVVAKSEIAYSILKGYFRHREITKVYHALVQGMPDPLAGTIEAPIGRHPHHDWKFAVLDGGKHAVTHYELLEAFGRATLVEVHLETGRTHQIRVHFAALNHPCVGDPLYGSNPIFAHELGLKRQWLHAYQLKFMHPTSGQNVEFTAPYPEDLQHSLEILRNPA